jgi:hypothetical protein
VVKQAARCEGRCDRDHERCGEPAAVTEEHVANTIRCCR